VPLADDVVRLYIARMTDDFRDDNRLGGRLSRYARVTGAMGGLAAQFAATRLMGGTIDPEKQAQELKAALGTLKGPVMKLAQILSTIPDAVPPEYARELAHLQANAPAMGWPFVSRRMRTELGENWLLKFGSFEREASAAASLGQVHKATSMTGQELAIKLQYPDMASAVEADLGQLDMILGLYRVYDKSINTGEIREELAERLREELDYVLEAKHLALYRYMLRDVAEVTVPDVLPDVSTKRLLTMTWLHGKPLMSFREADQETRNTIAINMFRAWYVPFHVYGVIHGDPHLGNYSIREDLGINLLDFGCVRVFPPSFVGGVIDLYRALRDGKRDLAVQAYETWGFTGLTNEMIDVLNIWARFIYAPLMEDKVQLITQSDKPGDYGRETAQKVHAELKKLGSVTPPREFVFMDRAAIGLGGVFLHLKAEVNWYRQFQDIIEDFSVERLAARQSQALAAAGLAS
jgi:predicted unusual protein kinase regulating ubiquinone biosynthesis (AarF/ABC1/UbiB family)